MAIRDFLHLESDAISENPVTIPFEWLVTDNIPADVKMENEIVITPITVRTWFRMKPLIFSIAEYNSLLHRENPDVPDIEIVNLMDKYDVQILEIIFLGIHNKPGNLPDWYKEALIDNCTWNDKFILLNAILFRIGQQSFFKSITTLKKVSPLTEQEIIAAQKNLESWTAAQTVQ